jgi:hypothetical protein
MSPWATSNDCRAANESLWLEEVRSEGVRGEEVRRLGVRRLGGESLKC